MRSPAASPLVHLELHTSEPRRARAFYAGVCGWRAVRIGGGGHGYEALGLGADVEGGIVECAAPRAIWLPYVEVTDVAAATERARELGAAVPLEPREGPAGWRSVVGAPGVGELGLWQPRRTPMSSRPEGCPRGS